MRRTKRISGLGVLAALLLVTSCESFLDPSPTDVLTPENFYRTSSDAVAATNAVYESTKWSYWLGFWYISDIPTDDIMAGAPLRPAAPPRQPPPLLSSHPPPSTHPAPPHPH